MTSPAEPSDNGAAAAGCKRRYGARGRSARKTIIGAGEGALMPRSKAASVTLFLNRLLGLALADQSLLLHLFNYLLGRAVRRARRDGVTRRIEPRQSEK